MWKVNVECTTEIHKASCAQGIVFRDFTCVVVWRDLHNVSSATRADWKIKAIRLYTTRPS